MNKKNFLYCSLLLLNAIIIYLFILHRTVIPLGWDTQFHLNRIEELYSSLLRGHLLSSTGTFAFSQIGLPINIFYPYLFLYPFAILRGLLNPVIAYNCGLFIFSVISFFIAYYSITKLSQNKRSGFLFSLIYNNSGYLLLQITYRGDIAEYIALLLLPIIFVGFEKLFSTSEKTWVYMPLGLALVAYDHILSVLIFSLFLFCLLLIQLKKINLLVIKRLLISILIVIVATIPLLYSVIKLKMQTDIIIPIVPDTLINEALLPSDLLLNSLNNLGPVELLNVNIGFISLIAGIFGIFAFQTKNRNVLWIEIIGLLFLLMSTKLFPWFLVQNTVISNIQFPWRFLGITTFCFAYVAANLFSSLKVKWGEYCLFVLISLISLNYIYQYLNGMQASLSFNNISEYKKVASNAVYTDYMPASAMKGMDRAKTFRSQMDVHKHIAVVNGKKVIIPSSNIKSGYNYIEYKLNKLNPNKEMTIILPILNYGENTTSVGNISVGSNGETVVKLKPRSSNQTIIVSNRN